jgi:hypothetical protein
MVALILGVVGLVAWLILLALAPSAALRGWLIGFLFVSALSLGSLAVVLVHRLTAGTWGAAFAPELEPAARATPVLCLFFLPVLLGLPLIYSWAGAPGTVDAGVHRYYLNPPLFILRSVIALGGWSAIALLLPRIEGRRGRLGAGLGLAFHGIMVSVVAVDWVLSILPSFTSSDFGMDMAVQQFACAFAWAGLQGRRRVAESPAGDLAGLLFAAIIGLTYLEFMGYLVVWYGDRPALDAWYLTRARWPWQTLSWFSLALGVASVVLLAIRRRFGTHRAVAMVGACVLVGVLSYQVWLLAPAFGAACLIPGAAALLAQGGSWVALIGGLPRFAQRLEAMVHAH